MRNAFTLIELLVVVTIIVVLVALLVPTLDQAIYQAELAVCGANLHGIGMGLNTYTVDFKRKYPIRKREFKTTSWRDTNIVIKPPLGDFDDRPPIRNYVSLNGHLNCPLNRKLDIEGSVSNTEAPYQLWFGFYFGGETPEPGMHRLGDRMRFTNPLTGQVSYFTVLASDMDNINGATLPWVLGTHPDHDGIMGRLFQQDELAATISRWQTTGKADRGLIDRNFAFADGSVSRITHISLANVHNEEKGLAKVPIQSAGGFGPLLYSSLPRQ